MFSWFDELVHSELGVIKFARILLFLALLGGIGWSAYFFYFNWQLSKQEIAAASSTPTVMVDARAIEGLMGTLNRLNTYMNQRKESDQMVLMAQMLRAEPFRPIDLTAELALLPPGLQKEAKPELIAPPPMELQAVIIVQGTRPKAILDVAGSRGLIVSVGDTFDEGKGKVVSIARDKVVVTWMGQRVELSISMVR